MISTQHMILCDDADIVVCTARVDVAQLRTNGGDFVVV
jgi:hypothetical protein